mmetsp:Transcript_54374/g.156346  ORF Transcript_54374/g.156346 Transcript_54374/m.156346 type:complete len:306 (+) Transcript_54374:322-1239(+)
MMKHVEVVARSWPLETVVSKPSANAAIDDAPKHNGGVTTEYHGNQRRTVVQGALQGVHVGSREGRRIVALVVLRVHVLVEEPVDVWDGGRLPRMHESVNRPKVRNSPVRDGGCPDEVVQRLRRQSGLELGEDANAPQMAEYYLEGGSGERGDGGCDGIVPDLLHAGVDGVDLELGQFLLEGLGAEAAIQQEVPATTNHPSCDNISRDDRPYPAELQSLRAAERRIVPAIIEAINDQASQKKRTRGCAQGRQVAYQVQLSTRRRLRHLHVRAGRQCNCHIAHRPEKGHVERLACSSHGCCLNCRML